MKKTAIAFAIVSAPVSAQSTDCIRTGNYTYCNTYQQPDTSGVDQLRQRLLDSTAQSGRILQDAQNDALQQRLMRQRIELQRQEIELQQQRINGARREQAFAQTPAPLPQLSGEMQLSQSHEAARAQVDKLIVEKHCEEARKRAAAYGSPDLIGRVFSACQ